MINKKVIRKYIEFLTTKIKVLRDQKKFIYRDTVLKYMLKGAKSSDTLVVVFSSCTRNGIKARYNYVRTLKDMDCNRLFILDDFADDHRGAYYLGSEFKFNEEEATLNLIKTVYSRLKCKKIVLCGSSKGGYAALDFGLQIKDSIMIVGAPQYFLADYLEAGNENALRHIIGTEDIENRKIYLNNYLKKRVIDNSLKKSQKIYMHYSKCEHTYFEHIKDLISDLEKEEYNLSLDIKEYENHSEISLYFPDYLKKTLSDVLLS